MFADLLQRLVAPEGRVGLVAAKLEQHGQELVGLGFVFDDQGGGHESFSTDDGAGRSLGFTAGRMSLTSSAGEDRPTEGPDASAARRPIVGIILDRARVTAGQDGGDSSPARLHALGEDPSAVHLDELLGDAQAKAQPALAEAEVARGMPAGIELGEERLEQVLERPRLQADSAILDDDLRLVRGGQPRLQLDLARRRA